MDDRVTWVLAGKIKNERLVAERYQQRLLKIRNLISCGAHQESLVSVRRWVTLLYVKYVPEDHYSVIARLQMSFFNLCIDISC